MKIVFIGGRDITLIGGIENYMYNLATELVKLGHEPIVFCESDHDEERIINGFRVVYLKGLKSAFLCKPYVGLKATLISVFKIRNVDIIHYNAWPPSLWCLIPKIRGIPSLMQGHGFEWQRSKYTPVQRKIMKFMEWMTAHLNQNLIMCSDEQTQYFKKHYKKDAVTIPTAINIPLADKTSDTAILARYNLKPKKYFLFLARLVEDKNPDYLIRAYQQINSKGIKLVVAGDNSANPKYVEYLKEIASENSSIIFTGAVYGSEKETLLRNAYTFCLPSTIEGLSISLLEAMSYKLPIIASAINANKEVLDTSNAIWVIPEDIPSTIEAFRFAIDNPDKLQLMVTYNYEKVKVHYTWESVTKRYVKYLNTIVK